MALYGESGVGQLMKKSVLLLLYICVLTTILSAQRQTVSPRRRTAPPTQPPIRNRIDPSLQKVPAIAREYVASFPEELRPLAYDWDEKYQTLTALVQAGPVSVPLLVRGVEIDYQLHQKKMAVPVSFRQIARHCAIALARIGDKRATDRLIKCVDFPDISTQREIIYALGKFGDKQAIPALLSVWADPQADKTNKREAAFALVRIGGEAALPVSEAAIQREQERLAVMTLLKIALSNSNAVASVATAAGKPDGRNRARSALEELQRRRTKWGQVPTFESLQKIADQYLRQQQYLDALRVWEQVIDCGLYSIDDEDAAREQILELKSRVGARLYPKPLGVIKNKVFILKSYEGRLPSSDGSPARNVKYSLTAQEIECLKRRFEKFANFVHEGSCGAMKVINEIDVVEEPWTKFTETIRQAPQNMGRYQISRKDLNENFDYERRYLQHGYGCVFFEMRGDLKTFEMDGGAAGANAVLNAYRTEISDLDTTSITHEWLHILHGRIWDQGYDWMQCLPLHEQIRDLTLWKDWATGRNTLQEDVFVDCMRRYVTSSMWESVGDLHTRI